MPDSEEPNVVGDLEEIIADCGYTDVDVPTDGPGSTYLVMVVPHLDQVYCDEDEDGDEEVGGRLGYRGMGLDGSCAVRIYAIADQDVSPQRRHVLQTAGGADLSRYEEGEPPDDPEAVKAAFLVDSWVSNGDWADRLALCYNNDPLTFAGPGIPDRPTAIVTIMLPASSWDEIASRY